MSLELLKSIWKEYTTSIAPQSLLDVWFAKIVNQYKSPNRKYHNLQQLENKLQLFLTMKDKIKNRTAFVLALYFQYYEYDPKESTSLEMNIAQFKIFAEEIKLQDGTCNEVTELLEATSSNITEEHMAANLFGKDDKHYFLDIDVAVLGAPPEEYQLYTKMVREEYSFLEDQYYKDLRHKVLQSFLLIPNIYATKEFREKYEEQAKENLNQELKALATIH